ncbi:hypothetical protein M422DRAFT_188721 [Sphaerobolus stellatus SS14]|uniref:Unplaced genomic scaffold SPHSTscaffold_211, whole genome shotgun sequence n=1 Tax=Sphaerobolus stellatus (strain SS14) TaxID=990650 RepID=A0A0C9UK82_SPHS4|nr:hypothetical protein M422DRAFT_188721 [Sphaerobolus stellatus SS14]
MDFNDPDTKFFLDPNSEPGSRTPSPPPFYRTLSESSRGYDEVYEPSPGVLPDDVYDSTLSWWRAGLRRVLVRWLKTESKWLGAMQNTVRNKYLDAYFLYASSLGTHTFFMTLLPAVFWFGSGQAGRGLVLVLGMGVYWTSFLKDLLCSPRPFTPPVTRLTIGKHHLEYGFPSTHSTNSVSMVLYVNTLLLRMENLSTTTLYTLQAIMAIYAFTIIYGRLYCGMHSLTDCTVGTAVGAAVWVTYWAIEDQVETWLATAGWYAPIAMVTTAMLMVNKHPQPVDDCPCFEDAIAFIASILGVFVGQWHAVHYNLLTHPSQPQWHMHSHSSASATAFFSSLKLFFGVFTVFTWRLVAKACLGTLLPKLFRLLSKAGIVDLGGERMHRRFYMPATEYKDVPMRRRGGGLDAIPSVIDLGREVHVQEAVLNQGGLRARTNGKVKHGENEKMKYEGPDEEVVPLPREEHYDAEVLTKMIVYTGIGLLAVEIMPLLFGTLGW